jgi:hypothetical protein
MRIKIPAILCDSCGKTIPNEDENIITVVTLAGPVSDQNGKFDICLDCNAKVAEAIGIGQKKGRPNLKVFEKPKSNVGGNFKPWTPEEEEKLIENIGLSRAETAKMLGRSAGAVYQKLTHLANEGRVGKKLVNGRTVFVSVADGDEAEPAEQEHEQEALSGV